MEELMDTDKVLAKMEGHLNVMLTKNDFSKPVLQIKDAVMNCACMFPANQHFPPVGLAFKKQGSSSKRHTPM